MSNDFTFIEAFVSTMVWVLVFFPFSLGFYNIFLVYRDFFCLWGFINSSLPSPDIISPLELQSGCILYFVSSMEISVVCGHAFLGSAHHQLSLVRPWPVLSIKLPYMCLCRGRRIGVAILLSISLLMPIQCGKGTQQSSYWVKYQSCNFY